MRTYDIQTTDTETPPSWTSAPHVVSARPGLQDSGRCRWTVVTRDLVALEDLLDADADVVSYNQIVPEIDLAFANGVPSTRSDAVGAQDFAVTLTRDGVAVTGQITLHPMPNGRLRPGDAPLDGWVSASLLEALAPLNEMELRWVVRALVRRAPGIVNL